MISFLFKQNFNSKILRLIKKDNKVIYEYEEIKSVKDQYKNNENTGTKIFGKNNSLLKINKDILVDNKIKTKSYFNDKCRIYVKAGNGGNGSLTFEKGPMEDQTRPDGGSGGNGGNIILISDKDISSLSYIRKYHYEGNHGKRGESSGRDGKSGKDLIINVPIGTRINEITRDYEINKKDLRSNLPYKLKFLFEFFNDKEKFIICKGGIGGKGNFKSLKKQDNNLNDEKGKEGEEKEIELELRCHSDVCLLGFPNAGKSTLIASMTRTTPKIASYEFTTIQPYKGKILYNDFSEIIIEDLPGIIEGASNNKGLGHKFLKHLENSKLIIIVLDGSNLPEWKRNPLNDLKILLNEVEIFNKSIFLKKFLIVLNKCDLNNNIFIENKRILFDSFKSLKYDLKIEDILLISGKTGENIDLLVNKIKEIIIK